MKLRLLVAEDSTEFRTLIVEAFSKRGWDVQSVESGFEALALIKAQKFDLLISDIRMPNGTGIELMRDLKRVKASEPDRVPPIIITSGLLGNGERYFRLLGAQVVIEKPFRIEQLIEAAKKCIPEFK